MAIKEIMVCDECDRHKQEGNGWFVVMLTTQGGTFSQRALFCAPIHAAEPSAIEDMKHYCGQGCVGKVFQRWMDTGSVEKVEVVHAAE